MKKFWFIFILSFVFLSGTLKAQSLKSIKISQQIDFNTTKSVEQDKPDIKIAIDSNFHNQKAASNTQTEGDTQKASESQRDCAPRVQNNNDIAHIKKKTDCIASNTKSIRDFSGWNCYAKCAFFLAIIALFISILTYISQWRTEKNTSNVPIKVQRGVLMDLPRHFYRNLVCTRAIYLLYKNEGKGGIRQRHPSEGNIMKLQVLPDDIVLPIGYGGSETKLYKEAHELKLLFRNYNLEVTVAAGHLSRREILEKSLAHDFDNLFFKPIHLVKSSFQYEIHLNPKRKELLVPRTIITILSEHLKKLQTPSNFKLLFDVNIQQFIKDSIGDFYKPNAETGSMSRSLNNLLGYGEKEAKDITGAENFGITFNENTHEAIIQRETFIHKLIEYEDKNNKEKFKKFLKGKNDVDGHPGILSISDKKEFTAFCIGMEFRKDTEDEKLQAELLYEKLVPYLDYLQKGEWNFRELFMNILTIDAAIETDRIGMVEYS